MSQIVLPFIATLAICALCGSINQAQEPSFVDDIPDKADGIQGRVMLGCLDITRIDEMNAWKNRTPDNASEAEEYAVYSDLLGRRKPGSELNRSYVRIINSNTTRILMPYDPNDNISSSFISSSWDGGLPGPDPDALDDFNQKNRRSYPLKNLFDLNSRYVLANESEIDEIYGIDEDGDWQGYFPRCPTAPGILEFSRVGFNKDMTQALVEIGIVFPAQLLGGGELTLLHKENGTWVISSRTMTWIS